LIFNQQTQKLFIGYTNSVCKVQCNGIDKTRSLLPLATFYFGFPNLTIKYISLCFLLFHYSLFFQRV